MRKRATRTTAVATTVIVGFGLTAAAPAAGQPDTDRPDRRVVDAGDSIVIRGTTYRMRIVKDGFRYSFETPTGKPVAPAHPTSGLRIKTSAATDFSNAAETRLVSSPRAATAVLAVTMTDGARVTVHIQPTDTYARVTVPDLPGQSSTVDFRTGGVAPAYGLGDYGSFADGQPEQGTPCSGNVQVRPSTELTGLVLDNLTNEGSCKRFITTFTVFPKQRFGQVWFAEGQKRVGLTTDENRLGAAGVDEVQSLYYFVGRDLRQVYADYRQARHRHGYVDAKPAESAFGLGWEAYGALAWNTYQSSVMDTVQGFLDHGYPLSWGVVGSGFWPGPRGNKVEGTTNSFGMWDDTAEEGRDDGLPNPRYPDPDALKKLFADNDIKLLLGARNNFKALPADGGNHNPSYDGPFLQEALDHGYLLRNADGTPRVVTRAQFPSGASYVLDGTNPEAVRWFVDRLRLWGVDGFKEDTMLYDPNFHLDGNWNAVQNALHDASELLMVRNAAYSVPGDMLRINDTIYGTGEVYHEDPDRMPVNLLNYAASGAGNLSPDIVGGTPGPSLGDPAYQRYFVRNAQFNAMLPVLTFGKGPWELGREDYAASVKRLALWHEALRPYIYDAVLDGYETGFPSAVTPLPLAYPDDPATYGLANDTTRQYEWMFGESLLATPVFGADFGTAQTRDVYLPAGKWIDIETGAVFHGPTTLRNYAIGADRIPAFAGGKGVLVTGKAGALTAEVYPVSTGSRYTAGRGRDAVTVSNANTGWDPRSLTVRDTRTGARVGYRIDPVTGALRFPVAEGHTYRLTGGGTAGHTVARDTAVPGRVTGLEHDTGTGTTTLSWDPVEGTRSYVVTAQLRQECGSTTPELVVGSATGTSLVFDNEGVAGTYRVTATNSVGGGEPSEPHSIEPLPGEVAQAVVVTNEGTPSTCDPDNPAYSESGSWLSSSLKGFDGSGSRYTRTAGLTATWRAVLPAGSYQVEVWSPGNTVCSADARYTVGGVTVPVDQCATGGSWHSIGTYQLPAGLAAVTLTAGSGATRADAVRFTRP
ncbi:TIM-barrel domain-containing protein [Plantactinospora sp. ZYX-F-223]|uniref:golvesin C-terminal-like domain-containing protein n=1 Tax=Plantactinospora sp. ZYX-F-223 TaxID=3144103 RepID=UPI0031FCCCE9